MVPLRVWQQWLQSIFIDQLDFRRNWEFRTELERALVEVVNCNPSIEEFEEWLEEAIPNEYWRDSRNSPLHIIAMYDGTSNKKTAAKLARALISAGHDEINYKNKYKATALECAIRSRNEEVALVLLEAGAAIDQTFYIYDNELLRLALIHRCPKVVEELIKLGCDVRSSSPLRIFFKHRLAYTTAQAKTVIKLLVDAGAKIEHMPHDLWNLMLQAINDEHINTAYFLVQRADYYQDKEETFSFKSLLFEAAGEGKSYLVRKLIVENLVDLEAVDDSGNTVLKCAVRNYEIVKFMIENGVSAECLLASHSHLLLTAVENKSYKMIDFLLQLKPDVDLEQRYFLGAEYTILIYAVIWNNHNNIIIRFLDHGAKMGAKCSRGRGVLYYAAQGYGSLTTRYVDLLQLLISRGAAADLTEEELMEIFHSIVKCNNENFVHEYMKRFLDESKFTVTDFRNLANEAALNTFTSEVLKYFVEKGGLDINSKDKDDGTILQRMWPYDSEGLSLRCFKYLVNTVFNLHKEDSEGFTAFIFELLHYHRDIPIDTRVECIRLILKYRSDYVNNELNLERVQTIEDTRNINQFCNISSYIVKHIAASEVNGTPIDQRNSVIVNTNPYILNFYVKCKAELSVMQEHEICNGLTLFHVLIEAKRFSRNKNVIKAFENQSFLSKFNIYRDDLVKNFEEARKRPKLIEDAQLGLQRIFPKGSLSVVWDDICKYLRNKDLRNLTLI